MVTETSVTNAANDIPVSNPDKDWSGTWYVRAMEHLIDVAQDLSHARDMDAIMAIVRIAARELTGADGATFVLRDGDQCYYAEENAVSPLWKGKRFPLSECISGWVIQNAQSIFISDVRADSRIPIDLYRPTFIKSLAMVPIRTQNPLGAIGNYWARTRTPNAKELNILQALANITALSIENADLYNRLQGNIQDLENSNAELERYAWVVSHDLKSPLRAVDNLASWVEEDLATTGSASAKINLSKLRQRTKRMEHTLNDLLEYSMVGELPLPQDSGPISGKTMLDEVIESIYVPDGFHITATPAFEALEFPRLPLQRVLVNLVNNAVKHHDKKNGVVTLDAEKKAGETIFTVTDNGPGVPEEFQQRIFELFQTLKPRDKTEGSGMGLAIAQKIVVSRGGEIFMRNLEPRGCVFTFSWPSSLPLKGPIAS